MKTEQASSQHVVITEVANDLAQKCALKLKFGSEGPRDWEIVLEKCAYVPVAYTNDNLTYELAYYEGREGSRAGKWFDLSCVILLGDESVGVWPITMSQVDGEYFITSQGAPLAPPLFCGNVKKSTRRKIVKSCVDFVVQLARVYKVKDIVSSDRFVNRLDLNEWSVSLRELGCKSLVYHDLYLEIQSPIEVITKDFRSSVRQRIKQGKKLWQVSILSENSDNIAPTWAEFQNLHLEASGRLTRSLRSWDIQKNAIMGSNAILVYLRDDSGRMIGGGYFTLSRDEAVYQVAAYDRSLFKLPIGHLVQYVAIEFFIKREIKWYRLGNRPNVFDEPLPSAKELAIGDFKAQFSSHLFSDSRSNLEKMISNA